MDMMTQRLERASAALEKLEEALRIRGPSTLERDGAIQRFEFSFEAFWKAAQIWLEAHEGLRCSSPRSCIRSLGQTGVLNATETTAALAMTDDRNLTVHTYHEETAQEIFQRLPAHAKLIRRCFEEMDRRLAEEVD